MKFIATRTRLEGLLTSVSEELLDVPLYYGMPDFSKTLHCSSPPINTVKAALINAGYRVSGYHKDPQAIKTNAPNRFIWDILRVWVQKTPLTKEPAENSAASKILAVEPTSAVDFTVPKELQQISANSNRGGKKKKVSRFPMNPEAHWGPKAKASGQKRKAEDDANVDR
jgi:tRNA (guanine26-N2/guanine27-N2)-dimethyltransferase